MEGQRETIIELISPLISDLVVKARNGRFRDKETARLRVSYCNALSNMIRSYNALLRDIELEEIQKELEAIKNELENNKE